jgi:hypothetical protein
MQMNVDTAETQPYVSHSRCTGDVLDGRVCTSQGQACPEKPSFSRNYQPGTYPFHMPGAYHLYGNPQYPQYGHNVVIPEPSTLQLARPEPIAISQFDNLFQIREGLLQNMAEYYPRTAAMFAVNYRQLNNYTISGVYPVARSPAEGFVEPMRSLNLESPTSPQQRVHTIATYSGGYPSPSVYHRGQTLEGFVPGGTLKTGPVIAVSSTIEKNEMNWKDHSNGNITEASSFKPKILTNRARISENSTGFKGIATQQNIVENGSNRNVATVKNDPNKSFPKHRQDHVPKQNKDFVPEAHQNPAVSQGMPYGDENRDLPKPPPMLGYANLHSRRRS